MQLKQVTNEKEFNEHFKGLKFELDSINDELLKIQPNLKADENLIQLSEQMKKVSDESLNSKRKLDEVTNEYEEIKKKR